MPSLTALAPEVLLQIFASLRLLDPPSLLKCAHLCRALRPYAHEVYFQDIELVETSSSADQTRKFAELLESNPDLIPYIRTLRLDLDLSNGLPPVPQINLLFGSMRITYDYPWYNPPPPPDVFGALPLARLTELRELVLEDGFKFSDPVGQLVALLYALPQLQRLVVRGVSVSSTERARFASQSATLPVFGQAPPPKLSLKTLECEYACRFPLVELVRGLLSHFSASLALESLVVRARGWDDLVEHHAGWMPLIDAMKTSLRHLDISTGERDHQMYAMSNGTIGNCPFHTTLFNALRECESLQTLRLNYLLPRSIAPNIDLHQADFLRSLCDMLESRPAFVDSLQSLTLYMIDWYGIAVSVSPALGHRLASVLSDIKRYPAFLSFQVEVQIDDFVYLEDDDPDPSAEGEEDPEIGARWTAAFADFARGAAGLGFKMQIFRMFLRRE